jgi:hypothetical protein
MDHMGLQDLINLAHREGWIQIDVQKGSDLTHIPEPGTCDLNELAATRPARQQAAGKHRGPDVRTCRRR